MLAMFVGKLLRMMKAFVPVVAAAAGALRSANTARCRFFSGHRFSTFNLPSPRGVWHCRPSFRTLSSEVPETIDISFLAGRDVVHCKVVARFSRACQFVPCLIHAAGCGGREHIGYSAQEQR
jgi:hypothetical protein